MEENPSTFVSGFVVGLCAGAIGYYLFATKEGAKIRESALQEWYKVREELATQGKVESTMGLREFIHQTLGQLSGVKEEIDEITEILKPAPVSPKADHKKGSSAAPKSELRFKGT